MFDENDPLDIKTPDPIEYPHVEEARVYEQEQRATSMLAENWD